MPCSYVLRPPAQAAVQCGQGLPCTPASATGPNIRHVTKSGGRAQAFDDLLLLKRGGRTIYCGPLGARSADMVAYFQVRARRRTRRPPRPSMRSCMVALLQRAPVRGPEDTPAA